MARTTALAGLLLGGCVWVTGKEEEYRLRIYDADNDGFYDVAYGGDDCNDLDASINPDADEKCDPPGVDDDCDGFIDAEDDEIEAEGVFERWRDADDDGYGDPEQRVVLCAEAAGFVDNDDDCDDDDDTTHPGAIEWCNGTGDDCDDQTSICYLDARADGLGGMFGPPAQSGFGTTVAVMDMGFPVVLVGAPVDNGGPSSVHTIELDLIDDWGPAQFGTDGIGELYTDGGTGFGTAIAAVPSGANWTFVVGAPDAGDSGTAFSYTAFPTGREPASTGDSPPDVIGEGAIGASLIIGDLPWGGRGGPNSLVLGAPGAGAADHGAVAIIGSSVVTWAPDTLLTSQSEGGRVGSALAIGDVTGDDLTDLVVAAGGARVIYILSAPPSGAAVIENESETSVFAGDMDGFGAAIALADVDGESGLDLIVGIPGFSPPESTAIVGAVAVFLAPLTEEVYGLDDAAVLVHGVEENSRFGASIAVGDLTEDGWSDVVLGAPGADDGAGAVYLMLSEGGPLVGNPPDSTLVVPANQTGLGIRPDIPGVGLGESLAIANPSYQPPTLIVGAPLWPNPEDDAVGAVFAFSVSTD